MNKICNNCGCSLNPLNDYCYDGLCAHCRVLENKDYFWAYHAVVSNTIQNTISVFNQKFVMQREEDD
jgi:hypothetical protein